MTPTHFAIETASRDMIYRWEMPEPHADRSLSSDDASGMMDRRMFGAQFRLAYSRLWLVAAGIVGDRTYADDIVQEAAVIALGKLDRFTPGSNFVAWMSEIVRRCAWNHARKTRDRKTVNSNPSLFEFVKRHVPAKPAAPRAVVSDAGMLIESQTEFDDQVIRALNALSEEARCCLLLRTVQQLSYAEISELMQIPAGTAMSHVHRGKSIMRGLLQPHRYPTMDDRNRIS